MIKNQSIQEARMDKKKKIIIGVVIAVVAVAAVVLSIVLAKGGGKKAKDKVYVEKVKTICGNDAGTTNRFSGVVEAQDSWKIKLDGDKKVKEVFVKVGDEVKEGDQLFSYDMDETNSQIEQANLELESITNEINDYNSQIATLSAERDAAPEEAKFDYTTQIQSVQNDLKQSEYNRKSKQLEIDKMKQSLGDAVVTSKMAGVVKTVSSSNGDSDDGSSDDAFMTILATGSYRVKCMINEQNMSEISEGEQMLIHSRVDEDQTWNGTISGIDMESPQSNGDQYTDSSDSSDTTTSSKYPFYINLENSDV